MSRELGVGMVCALFARRRSSLALGLGLLLFCLTRPAQAQSIEKDGWKLGGSHLVLSVERLATLAVWREIEGSWGGANIESRTWGVEASLLTANSTRRSMTVPRVAFDYVTSKSLTLGGSLGYVRSGGKQGKPNERQYVIAPRIGSLIAFDRIAVWLRAGITFSSWSSTHENHDPVPCDACDDFSDQRIPPRVTETRTTYSLTVDPQLLVCLAPRIALSVGISLDEGFGGSFSRDYATKFSPYDVDLTSSAYALTTGISIIF
jgi:hypothetical protein